MLPVNECALQIMALFSPALAACAVMASNETLC